MNRLCLLLLLAVFSSHVAGQTPEPVTINHWGDSLEWFVEIDPPLAGQPATLIVHLTDLATFEPIREGMLELALHGPDGTVSTRLEKPVREGVYIATLTPESAGNHRLDIRLHDDHGERRLLTEPFRLFADTGEAGRALAGQDGADDIVFYKELQWRMDFAVETARIEFIALRLTAPGRVVPAPGGQARIAAPVDGIVLAPAPDISLPARGDRVTAGQVIARIAPLTESAEASRLTLDMVRARERLQLAERELARLQGLYSDGVIPERRLQEARTERNVAREEAATARRRLDRLIGEAVDVVDAARLAAPIGGILTAADVVPGERVAAGQVLATVIDARRVWVEVHLYPSDLASLHDTADLALQLPGEAAWRRLPSVLRYDGVALTPDSGAVPLVFEVNNPDGRLRIGLPLTASLAVAPASERVTVPWSALLDDDGVEVVIVQSGGETFERRPVRTGYRAAGRVVIEAGLEANERIVTRGAYAVLLAGREEAAGGHHHSH
jgi:membrane fusion protein, heavy metal efflux system